MLRGVHGGAHIFDLHEVVGEHLAALHILQPEAQLCALRMRPSRQEEHHLLQPIAARAEGLLEHLAGQDLVPQRCLSACFAELNQAMIQVVPIPLGQHPLHAEQLQRTLGAFQDGAPVVRVAEVIAIQVVVVAYPHAVVVLRNV